MFSLAHVHLLVNHAPILGALFALALLIASLFAAPDALRRTAFVVLVVTALAGGAADLTGEPAEDAIRGFPGVRRAMIHDHEEMGDLSAIAAGVLGTLALVALVRWRRRPVPRGIAYIGVAGTAVLFGMMAYTGLLGGLVRHTEVRSGSTPADATFIEPRPNRPPRPNP